MKLPKRPGLLIPLLKADDPRDAWRGAQQPPTTVLDLVGVAGVIEPILEKRPAK